MTNHCARLIAAPLAGIFCAVAAFAAVPNASGQCAYEVTALVEGPPCGPFGSPLPLIGRGMNSYSHVVGSHAQCMDSGNEAFYWTPQTGRVTLPRPPGVWSASATDINDNGLIVGGHAVSGAGWKGFVYDPAARAYTYLEPLHAGHGPLVTLSSINAINEAGIAVGSRVISKPGVTPVVSNAVIWDTNTGEVIDLGVGDGPNSGAFDGTESNDAAGWTGTQFFSANARGVLWTEDGIVEVGVLPGMVQSYLRAVNEHLEAIGTSSDTTPGGWAHFLWHDGQMMQLYPPDGYDLVGASNINNSRQIVGHMRVEGTSTNHPMLWQHGEFHNLHDLIVNPPSSPVTGVVRVANNGLMLAGTLNNRAVVLAPIGQPTGDLNYDCRVDVHDLLILLDAWGAGAAHEPAAGRAICRSERRRRC